MRAYAKTVEITPEMIGAGIKVFSRVAPSLAPDEHWVSEIFRAMIDLYWEDEKYDRASGQSAQALGSR